MFEAGCGLSVHYLSGGGLTGHQLSGCGLSGCGLSGRGLTGHQLSGCGLGKWAYEVLIDQ